jgi:hypothetical protein
MIRRDLDADAVSSSIATVLLFAGVLAIISGMMVTLMPVINELHGAAERGLMVGQMEDLSAETLRLSESGVPGDAAKMTIRPHTGNLGWQLLEGGTWYTATHQADSSFRLEGVLDLDDSMRFRHPEHRVESLCATNLHASSESNHHYRVPILDGTLTATPLQSLTTPLGPRELTFQQGGVSTSQSLEMDATWSQSSLSAASGEAWIASEVPLRVVMWRGQGGTFLATPDRPDAISDAGRAWTVPLLAGDHALHVVSNDPFTLEWESASASGTGASTQTLLSQYPDGESSSTHVWDGSVSVASDQRLVLRTSADARLVIRWGDAQILDGAGPGAVPWPDRGGAWTGIHFQPPAMDGSLILHNPNTAGTTARIAGLYHAIGGMSSIRIPWSATNPSWIEASSPIQVEWVLDDQTVGDSATHAVSWRPGSLFLAPAEDTGRTSGSSWVTGTPSNGGTASIPSLGTVDFILQPAGPSASWSTSATTVDPANDSAGNLNHGDSAQVIGLANPHGANFALGATAGGIRLWAAAGADGAAEIPEDGADRCVNIDLRASGWIGVDLPWTSVQNWEAGAVRDAWRDGTHFFGVGLTLRGAVGDEPHVTLGTAWALHLPRLVYTFDSSVTNLEIISQAGFVGTNHPEYRPEVLVPPPSREGPGPRLAATVPVSMPTLDSLAGSTELTLLLTLEGRDQLTTMTAHQVRRGWDGPYGMAIAAESAENTGYSADWLAFPGQLDKLNDYVGWVQTSPSMSEVVYHSGGEPVLFNLQVATLISHSSQGDAL